MIAIAKVCIMLFIMLNKKPVIIIVKDYMNLVDPDIKDIIIIETTVAFPLHLLEISNKRNSYIKDKYFNLWV